MSGSTGLEPALEYHVINSLGWSALRPLQRDAVEPVRSGADCVLVAPTAGGKTEAALFPLLTRMVQEDWRGTSVLYLTPLRALLNNLHPRLETYTAWLGRQTGLWHGDVGDSARRRMLSDRPDVLLTTPESLEAMLVSRRVDHRAFFSGVRAVVVDELHAFAGADRGWHLLAVLERIQRLADRPIQRVGLSATVGNPDEMLHWLQGSAAGSRPSAVVAEDGGAAPRPEITLDYVGSTENAAILLSRLYRGEKRLVFCEARATAEDLAFELRRHGVTTFVSHSSLSADERRQSERAFAEAQDCVIVATSTLELGIDIGDLDRVIQLDAPRTVASLLQRLGRTGRRPGTVRNMLVLATTSQTFLRCAGVLLLWDRGYVEPVVPPPSPRHIAAQQLLALALQEGRFGPSTWRGWWGDSTVMADGETVLDHLRAEEFLVEDGGLCFIGPRAEKEFGRRHFLDLLASFTADLELRVIAGRREIGRVSPLAVSGYRPGGDKNVLLAGRSWQVEHVDWEKFEVLVDERPDKGKVRWASAAVADSFEICRAQREVLLGADPDVELSDRARRRMVAVREDMARTVDRTGLVLEERGDVVRLWSWAGTRANETLTAALGVAADATSWNEYIDLPREVGAAQIRGADVAEAVPRVDPAAVDGLKFSVALPPYLAAATLAERFADHVGAAAVRGAALVVRGTGDVGASS